MVVTKNEINNKQLKYFKKKNYGKERSFITIIA